MKNFFKFNSDILSASEKAIKKVSNVFLKREAVTRYNQEKVLKAFIDCGVSERHFVGSTGYGYGDVGRDMIDKVFSKVFGSEDAVVRSNFVNGTHAITIALFGLLRPNDTMLCVTGDPYDTLKDVIGVSGKGCGSLKDFSVNYKKIDLLEDGSFDYERILNSIDNKVKVVYIQRSRGYTLRRSIMCEEIKSLVQEIKKINKTCVIVVDNCYGEFVETEEPIECGADIIAGSLIKNPGGGVARSGGYIAGKKEFVLACSNRLTVPGMGKEVGATGDTLRELFLGLFSAPHVVGEALKTAIFCSAFFEELGYDVTPKYNDKRSDIVQVLFLKDKERLIKFCQGIQAGSPIDSFVKPLPWDMPGYDDQVIMAAGTFTAGSSIELSADAPLKNPYVAFIQGGLNFDSAKIGVMSAAQRLIC